MHEEGRSAHTKELWRELINQLCAMQSLDTPDGRNLFINLLSEQLPDISDVPRHGRTRLDILEIVHLCQRLDQGPRHLADAVEDMAPRSGPAQKVRELVDALTSASAVPGVLPALPETDADEVRALLARLPHLDAHGLLYAAAGDLPLPDRPVTGLGAAFDHLVRANARPDGLLPVTVLVEHVAAALDRAGTHPGDAAALREWNDARTAGAALGAPLAALRAELGRAPAAQPAPACLVVQLCRSGMDPDRYLLSHWRQLRPGPWRPERGEDRLVTLAEVAGAVDRLVQRTEEEWAARTGRPVLEFILPFHLLNQELEWPAPAPGTDLPEPLGLVYPVVLRSLDRMRAKAHHRKWRNRWQQLLDSPDTACHWDTADRRDHDAVRWSSELVADESLIAVALAAPPVQRPGTRSSLEVALRAGVPTVFWDRRPQPAADFRKRARKLLKGKAVDLPQRVQLLRKEAATATAGQRDTHVGRHLAVLFDDPDRLVDWAGAPHPGAASGAPHRGAGTVGGGHDDEGET
ncbi:hypothetical protein ACIQRS_10290 [Streptomyces termitum]|uniref:Uncharacterized protein n=1 Tax=Streptomyces termitum TaxID=67368 RepID=A0A918SSA5_9ACTN|nr:hypothetical protein [Streptomyces termitum]GHA68254.1 hypothetical protein GCM10010305_07840 [Streptomyces termitum]